VQEVGLRPDVQARQSMGLGLGWSPEATAGKVLAGQIKGTGGQAQWDVWLFKGGAFGPVDL
jgi:hypothetical protein